MHANSQEQGTEGAAVVDILAVRDRQWKHFSRAQDLIEEGHLDDAECYDACVEALQCSVTLLRTKEFGSGLEECLSLALQCLHMIEAVTGAITTATSSSPSSSAPTSLKTSPNNTTTNTTTTNNNNNNNTTSTRERLSKVFKRGFTQFQTAVSTTMQISPAVLGGQSSHIAFSRHQQQQQHRHHHQSPQDIPHTSASATGNSSSGGGLNFTMPNFFRLPWMNNSNNNSNNNSLNNNNSSLRDVELETSGDGVGTAKSATTTDGAHDQRFSALPSPASYSSYVSFVTRQYEQLSKVQSNRRSDSLWYRNLPRDVDYEVAVEAQVKNVLHACGKQHPVVQVLDAFVQIIFREARSFEEGPTTASTSSLSLQLTKSISLFSRAFSDVTATKFCRGCPSQSLVEKVFVRKFEAELRPVLDVRLLPVWRRIYQHDDELIFNRLCGVYHVNSSFHVAARLLIGLDDATTQDAMMEVLVTTLQTINQEMLEARGKSTSAEIGADSLLPAVFAVLCSVRLKHAWSTLQFLSDLVAGPQLRWEGGYALATFSSALSFVYSSDDPQALTSFVNPYMPISIPSSMFGPILDEKVNSKTNNIDKSGGRPGGRGDVASIFSTSPRTPRDTISDDSSSVED
eukprot:PhM_4_TR16052/c0_g1_i1/m.98496